jgi:hypothetical protein
MLTKPSHPELTVEALTKWLRQQPPEMTYVWSDPVFCLVGHYLADNDSAWGAASYSELPDYELIAKSEPHTFGAALARAEKLLALPAPEVREPVPAPIPELELTNMQEVFAPKLTLPAPEPSV